jgi:hypothetical protein
MTGRRYLTIAALSLSTLPLSGAALAQSTPATAPPPSAPPYTCDSPAARQFDFWVGDWEFNGPSGGGINRVSKILDNCVVFENFSGTPLKGQSLSVFDRATQKWKQTWVDNTAGYLDFSGGFADGRMILAREFEKDGKKVAQRMVWFDIQADKFQWNWERSDDDGKTWKVLWHIDYKRVK